MGSMTVRNISEDTKHRFRQVAAANGRSMEEHLRHMIVDAAAMDIPTAVPNMDVLVPAPADTHTQTGALSDSRARIEMLIARGRGLDMPDAAPSQAEQLRDMDFS